MNEAETRAEHIDPALKEAGWGVVEGSKVLREHPITLGRLEGLGGRRRKPLCADYVLVYRNHKLAVIEAKAWMPPVTRAARAVKARPAITTHFTFKQQAFLDFVLAQYVSVGVGELSQEKLSPLLRLRYNNAIAVADLGPPQQIRKVFSEFQQYLYL